MADGRHLEKWKNRNISALVRPISTKRGKATQFDTLEASDGQHSKNSKNLKIQDSGSRRLKKSKNCHISSAV